MSCFSCSWNFSCCCSCTCLFQCSHFLCFATLLFNCITSSVLCVAFDGGSGGGAAAPGAALIAAAVDIAVTVVDAAEVAHASGADGGATAAVFLLLLLLALLHVLPFVRSATSLAAPVSPASYSAAAAAAAALVLDSLRSVDADFCCCIAAAFASVPAPAGRSAALSGPDRVHVCPCVCLRACCLFARLSACLHACCLLSAVCWLMVVVCSLLLAACGDDWLSVCLPARTSASAGACS